MILNDGNIKISKTIYPGGKHEMLFDRRKVEHNLDLNFSYRVRELKQQPD